MTIKEKETEIMSHLNHINELIGDGNRITLTSEEGECVLLSVINGELLIEGNDNDCVPYFYNI